MAPAQTKFLPATLGINFDRLQSIFIEKLLKM